MRDLLPNMDMSWMASQSSCLSPAGQLFIAAAWWSNVIIMLAYLLVAAMVYYFSRFVHPILRNALMGFCAFILADGMSHGVGALTIYHGGDMYQVRIVMLMATAGFALAVGVVLFLTRHWLRKMIQQHPARSSLPPEMLHKIKH